ncbi:MAG: hypothetical protein N3E42_01665 [Candidatus Bipolaricaulota bacterium]|nr:hypothetical protein [Candidatus Bipolaricaulota bacterium]
MIEVLLRAHGDLRWVVLALIIVGIGRAGWGWFGSPTYSRFDRLWGAISSALMDLQILLGFVIFFLLAPPARPTLWHPAFMIGAALSVHLGAIFARRLTEDRRKHYVQLLAYLVGLLFVLLGIRVVRGSIF